jgi:hypothetical protein
MASQPLERPGEDLAHIIQYAQIAAMVVAETPGISDATRDELRDLLNGIEDRARAAAVKLESPHRRDMDVKGWQRTQETQDQLERTAEPVNGDVIHEPRWVPAPAVPGTLADYEAIGEAPARPGGAP